jgi:hypothetical protein
MVVVARHKIEPPRMSARDTRPCNLRAVLKRKSARPVAPLKSGENVLKGELLSRVCQKSPHLGALAGESD